jgi:dTDP-4-amino-4,6-dideoxygalactose transaminase
MTTPFAPVTIADPGAAYAAHREEIEAAVRRVLESGRYILGEEVAAFEREFAAYIGVRFCVGVASGTDALHLALRAYGIGTGDHVLTAANTSVATVAAIHLAGATPVLADIDPASMTLDPGSVERAVRAIRVKAIIPVHLYGCPCNMDAIGEIAARYDALVIEDCAQSHGAAWRGRRTGALGQAGCFSFYPTKNLGAIGDGGAVVTSDPQVAETLRSLREYGWRSRHISEVPGMNTRLDEIQAAVLRVKLHYLEEENNRRCSLAARYSSSLSRTALTLPATPPEASHVWHQYVIRTDRRELLRARLAAQLIETAVLYPRPIHLQPGYRRLVRVPTGGVPVAERASNQILSLPIHAMLDPLGIDRVARTISECLAQAVDAARDA